MPHKDPKQAAAFKKKWREKNIKKVRAKRRAAYWADRQGALDAVRRNRLQRVYGITVEQYDVLLQSQNGVCAICLRPPLKHRLAVDHCHKTLRVRGLLCSRCNSMLGRMQDDAAALERAAAYLRR